MISAFLAIFLAHSSERIDATFEEEGFLSPNRVKKRCQCNQHLGP